LLVKIYTRAGDSGETGLLDGSRKGKDHPRVVAYGEVDELNAALGVVRSQADPELAELIHGIQKDLFALGAHLADPSRKVAGAKAKAAVTAEQVERLEQLIDERESVLPPLRAFVLPGGSPLAAFLHLARTVCRRAERGVVFLARSESVEPLALAYLNRLSDLLFTLARQAHVGAGGTEEQW
jgi:cob(I)alamin adenosyltransferase